MNAHWPNDIFQLFKEQEISLVAYVPDAGHAALIRACQADPAMRAVPLTTEEEGIPLAAGAYMGGLKSAILMQSSGTGNCINMLSLVATCQFPLLMLVTMRGEWGEFNPWQIPMGQGAQKALEVAGVIVQRADRPDEVYPTVSAAARLAYNSQAAVAVLLGQRLMGSKSFGVSDVHD